MDDMYLTRVLAGDASKYSYFVEKYKDMAFSIAYRIVGSREDAEEIVQDAFLNAYRALRTFRRDAKFSTWFYRIVVNRALSKVKRKRAAIASIEEEISESSAADVDAAFESLAQAERRAFISAGLDRLSVDDRLILTVYYLSENSIEEIVEITGVSAGNVKMKLHRARKRLYAALHGMLKSELASII